MGNSLKFAGYIGRVFLVNVAAGVGVAAGIAGTLAVAVKLTKPQLKKAWDSIPTADDNETPTEA